MNSKLQRQMHDCRMYLGQLRSFEEKVNELFSSLDTFEHLSQIQDQRSDLEQRSNRILIDETAKSLNLMNVTTTYLKNLLIKLDDAIKTRKTSEDMVNGIVFRTKELVALGTMRDEFEDLSKGKNLFYRSHNLSHWPLYPDVLKIKTIIVVKKNATFVY